MNKQEYMDKLKEALKSFDEEVRNEIVADYEEHFDMGLASGKTEEEVIAELGSIEELVKELKELNGETKKGFSLDDININGEDVVNAINDVAKGFAGFLGSLAGTITKGAGKMSESVSDGAESFADSFKSNFESVSDKVINKTNELAKEVAESYKAARGEEAGREATKEETVSETEDLASGNAESIVVEADCAEIEVGESDSDKIEVKYTNFGSPNQKLAFRFESYTQNGVFYAKVKRQFSTTNFFKSLSCPRILLEVKLPKGMKKVEINTASGKIDCKYVESDFLKVHNVSGSIDINDTKVNNLECGNVSGCISIEATEAKYVSANSVSGKTNLTGTFEETRVSTTSGVTSLDIAKAEKITVSSISGTTNIHLAECSGYDADISAMSGNSNCSFGDSNMKGSRGGHFTLGDGSVKIKISAMSGNTNIEA